MKKLLWMVALLPAFLWSGQAELDALFAQAKAEGKIAMVFVQTDSCPWCKRMKERVFTNPMVAEKLEADVVIGYFDKNRDNLPEAFGARSVPTMHLVSGEGEKLMTIPGYMPPGPFIGKIEEAQAKLP
jgi:thioredoxin-related protein